MRIKLNLCLLSLGLLPAIPTTQALSAHCQQQLLEERHYDSLKDVLNEDIEWQQAIMSTVQAKHKSCGQTSPDAETMSNALCLAWKTLHDNFQVRLEASSRRKENLLRPIRDCEAKKPEAYTYEDDIEYVVNTRKGIAESLTKLKECASNMMQEGRVQEGIQYGEKWAKLQKGVADFDEKWAKFEGKCGTIRKENGGSQSKMQQALVGVKKWLGMN